MLRLWEGARKFNSLTVSGHGIILMSLRVKGDGVTDDSSALNAILAENAARGKISYFPYGVYIVRDTLYVPPGSRIVGEAWAVISGKMHKRFLLGGYRGTPL